tara:strand:+ start:244 stop:975 length:732 start_codon:yes stop_codon:yes gene_type:complete
MSVTQKVFGAVTTEEDDYWLTVSDLMAGLMVIFLFIAISYIMDTLEQQSAIEKITKAWQESQIEIYEALNEEFKEDFKKWDAEIERDTLIVRFNNPEVLFDQGRAGLTPKFKNILTDFCPRYLDVLVTFRKSIDEVRIEGHTSSEWNFVRSNSDEAYFGNMELSQDRTRSVLRYCLQLDFDSQGWLKDWARTTITANGLSSSRLILTRGEENKAKSRRVEFRVQTKTKEEIIKIIGTLGQGDG